MTTNDEKASMLKAVLIG